MHMYYALTNFGRINYFRTMKVITVYIYAMAAYVCMMATDARATYARTNVRTVQVQRWSL